MIYEWKTNSSACLFTCIPMIFDEVDTYTKILSDLRPGINSAWIKRRMTGFHGIYDHRMNSGHTWTETPFNQTFLCRLNINIKLWAFIYWQLLIFSSGKDLFEIGTTHKLLLVLPYSNTITHVRAGHALFKTHENVWIFRHVQGKLEIT